jgi:hypothetical protein
VIATGVVAVTVENWLSVVGTKVILIVLDPSEAVKVSTMLVSGLTGFVVETGKLCVGVGPGAGLNVEKAGLLDGAELEAGPGLIVKVIPSVVIAEGPVLEPGMLMISVPITIPLGPRMTVIPTKVTVELVGPNVNVEPPKTISVTEEPEPGCGAEVGTGSGAGLKVKVTPSVVIAIGVV